MNTATQSLRDRLLWQKRYVCLNSSCDRVSPFAAAADPVSCTMKAEEATECPSMARLEGPRGSYRAGRGRSADSSNAPHDKHSIAQYGRRHPGPLWIALKGYRQMAVSQLRSSGFRPTCGGYRQIAGAEWHHACENEGLWSMHRCFSASHACIHNEALSSTGDMYSTVDGQLSDVSATGTGLGPPPTAP